TFYLFLEAGEKGFEIAEIGNGAVFTVLEQLDLAEDVAGRVVERGGGDENNAFASANLREHFVGLVGLGAEAVGFVNEDVGVRRCVPGQQVVKFADGFEVRLSNLEVAKHVWPGTAFVAIEQVGRGNDKVPSVKLLGEHGGHVGFAQANHIREEDAAV